jgi:PAS domain S-box-containing protein
VYRGNKLVKTLGILRDVTERKQYARMLREVNQRLQAVLDASHQIIFMKDRNSTYQTVNKTFERYFGIAAHKIIGKDDYLLFTSQKAEMLRAEDQVVFQSGKTLTTEKELLIQNRKYVFRTTKVPIRDDQDQVVGLAGFAEDITELVEKEKELFKLSQMLERSPISIIITDAEGRIEYVNPYFTQLTGYSQPEVLGKNPRIWKSQEHPRSFYAQLWRTIKQGNIWQGEILNRKKNGELYWENVTIGPVRDENGQITNFVAFKIDITEKKSIELQYQQAQKMEAVGRLAGGVAHDFNNILTVINGYCELILRKLKPKSSFYNEIVSISRAGQKATNLTNQLLAFSRRQIIRPRVLNLNDIITDTVKMLKRLIGEDIELKTILEKRPQNIRMDPGQIEQILMNLVVNARDAMPQGGTLIIETQSVELDESYVKKRPIVKTGQYTMLAVTDTGIGMDSRTQARIFEPFFTTKSKGKGTGLGLSTVYGIVKQNNGYIWVYSEPRKGTTFKIYLPVHHGEAEARTSQEDFQTTGGHETILLVEDDSSVRELTREILENAGYRVLEAANGSEAIRIFQQHQEEVELLLSDVVMPRMSGRDLLNRLQDQKPGLKAVFMSGYTDNAIVHHGVLEKHTHFIQKPFSPSTLLQKVREALDSPTNPA